MSEPKTIVKVLERLARMEERQIQLYDMMTRSLAEYGNLANRVTALEALKHRALGMIAIIGGLCTLAWELIKDQFHKNG